MALAQLLAIVHARHEAFRSARELTRDRLAPDFSPFQFIDERETRLSEILAWILNPKGSHGQGERFLAIFFERLGVPWSRLDAADALVRTEVATHRIAWPNRRIDILLEGRGWTVAIENKPWAGDQQNQVSDYLSHLDQLEGPHRCLIYLSGPGGEPSEESITTAERETREKAGELRLWSYEGLVPWLQACKGICRADRVTIFLDEFIRYIQDRFTGVRDVTEGDQIVDAIMQSDTNLEAAMLIVANVGLVRRRLLDKLIDQVRAAAPSGWSVYSELEDGKNKVLYIDFPDVPDHRFGVEFATASGRRHRVSWGVSAKHPERPYKDIRKRVHQVIGSGDSNKWWPWWKWASAADVVFPIDQDWDVAARPWTMIAKGEMHGRVIAAAQTIGDILAGSASASQNPAATLASTSPPPASPAAS